MQEMFALIDAKSKEFIEDLDVVYARDLMDVDALKWSLGSSFDMYICIHARDKGIY